MSRNARNVPSTKTVNKHLRVCEGFIMYINDYSSAVTLEQITVAEANSKFYNQAGYEGLDDFSKDEVKTILLKFFVFLETIGVENNKVLRSLKK